MLFVCPRGRYFIKSKVDTAWPIERYFTLLLGAVRVGLKRHEGRSLWKDVSPFSHCIHGGLIIILYLIIPLFTLANLHCWNSMIWFGSMFETCQIAYLFRCLQWERSPHKMIATTITIPILTQLSFKTCISRVITLDENN